MTFQLLEAVQGSERIMIVVQDRDLHCSPPHWLVFILLPSSVSCRPNCSASLAVHNTLLCLLLWGFHFQWRPQSCRPAECVLRHALQRSLGQGPLGGAGQQRRMNESSAEMVVTTYGPIV